MKKELLLYGRLASCKLAMMAAKIGPCFLLLFCISEVHIRGTRAVYTTYN